MKFAQSATVIGIIQVILIVSGFVITAGLMKAHGYPNNHQPFPPVPLLVREFLFLLMLIPLIWTILASLDYSRWELPEIGIPLHILTGAAMILFLFVLMIYSIAQAWYGPYSRLRASEFF